MNNEWIILWDNVFKNQKKFLNKYKMSNFKNVQMSNFKQNQDQYY